MNKWIPFDYYHQKPKEFQEVILTDGDKIYYQMCWLEEKNTPKFFCKAGWYHIDGSEPLNIEPTHWMILELP